MKVIDLTLELDLGAFIRDAHAGTHVDAPAYVFNGGKMLAEFKPDMFVGNAVLLDLRHKKPGQPIDDEDLEAAEESAGLAVREGETIILNTGWSSSHQVGDSLGKNTYLSENGAQYLEFKRATIIGTDSPSVDPLGSAGLPAHAALLGKGILVLEGLSNLDKIEQSRFRLVALPLKVNAPTSPVRAVAVLSDSF